MTHILSHTNAFSAQANEYSFARTNTHSYEFLAGRVGYTHAHTQ